MLCRRDTLQVLLYLRTPWEKVCFTLSKTLQTFLLCLSDTFQNVLLF